MSVEDASISMVTLQDQSFDEMFLMIGYAQCETINIMINNEKLFECLLRVMMSPMSE